MQKDFYLAQMVTRIRKKGHIHRKRAIDPRLIKKYTVSYPSDSKFSEKASVSCKLNVSDIISDVSYMSNEIISNM